MGVRDLAAELVTASPGVTLRQATVASTATGPNSVGIKIGASLTTVTGIRYLSSYTPTVNDVVFVLQSGTDLLVLGKLA